MTAGVVYFFISSAKSSTRSRTCVLDKQPLTLAHTDSLNIACRTCSSRSSMPRSSSLSGAAAVVVVVEAIASVDVIVVLVGAAVVSGAPSLGARTSAVSASVSVVLVVVVTVDDDVVVVAPVVTDASATGFRLRRCRVSLAYSRPPRSSCVTTRARARAHTHVTRQDTARTRTFQRVQKVMCGVYERVQQLARP
jgi:hypothetical protein